MIDESEYEIESEGVDVAKVKEALDLNGEPLWVRMEGRTVVFEYPVEND